MFISLKFKAIILTSLLVIALSSFFAQLNSSQLHRQFEHQRAINYQRHQNELQGLIQQSRNHLLQLIDLLPLLNTSDLEQTLAEHWMYLQINWDINGVSLYNQKTEKINSWGSQNDISKEKINEVIKTGEPKIFLNCSDSCSQALLVPIIDGGNGFKIIAIETTINDILRNFKEITGAEIGIVQPAKSDTPDNRLLDNWQHEIIALTNFKNNVGQIKVAQRQINISQINQKSQTVSFNDTSLQLGLIDVNNTTQGKISTNTKLLIIEDVTKQINHISNASIIYITGAIAAVVLSSLAILWMLWHPITRLRQLAQLLPLLSKGEFEYVRKSISQHKQKKWLRDEIDILDQSEIEVSQQLEEMKEEIDSRTTELQTLVMFDSLTGLANRRAILDEIQAELKNSSKNFSLLFLDLDHFKRINDSLGHHSGDKLLQVIGKRIRSCVRQADTVARLGGDEFCVLIRNLADPSHRNIVANNILHILKNPVRLGTHEIIVSASIGIVSAPDDGTSTEALLQNADLAMYRAKAQGRNKYQHFDHSMTAQAVEKMALESELRQALINKEFVLHYQPQIDLSNNQITSVEALVRWQHPERGLLAPGHFVSALEETGLIVPLGEWVLIEACEALKRWLDMGLPAIKMSVNLSPRQFQDPKLFAIIEETLKTVGIAPNMLELEITESMVMQDIENQNTALKQIQRLGVYVAIDDFGTGYSSLSYLKTLPVDTLKIDRSFIADIPADETDMEITSAIIAVAKKLGLKIVAEGIETTDQQLFLMKEQCDIGQGYLFSKPISEENTIELLKSSQNVITMSLRD